MKILIVGIGMYGSTVARQLAEVGHSIHMIDARDHIGGNCYDYVNEHGIRVHKYGPHLFHTRNKGVFEYLSRFTEWVPYQHKVKAILSTGQYVTLPVNKETAEIVGKDNIVDVFFRPYTKKMWAMDIEELDPSIINRVPVRDDMNELYFPNDEYQFMPKEGYTKLIENMINHPSISISLNTHFDKQMEDDYDYIFNSMAIDEYYDFCYGELPYRSIKFHHVNVPSPKLLPTATVNFTHTGPYTRVTEWKNIPEHGVNDCMTTLTYEEPCDYKENSYERYYPIKDKDGNARMVYKKYAQLKHPKMEFIGRCGMYVYIDMDQAVNSAIATSRRFIETH